MTYEFFIHLFILYNTYMYNAYYKCYTEDKFMYLEAVLATLF